MVVTYRQHPQFTDPRVERFTDEIPAGFIQIVVQDCILYIIQLFEEFLQSNLISYGSRLNSEELRGSLFLHE